MGLLNISSELVSSGSLTRCADLSVAVRGKVVLLDGGILFKVLVYANDTEEWFYGITMIIQEHIDADAHAVVLVLDGPRPLEKVDRGSVFSGAAEAAGSFAQVCFDNVDLRTSLTRTAHAPTLVAAIVSRIDDILRPEDRGKVHVVVAPGEADHQLVTLYYQLKVRGMGVVINTIDSDMFILPNVEVVRRVKKRKQPAYYELVSGFLTQLVGRGLDLHCAALAGAFMRNDYTAHRIKRTWPGRQGTKMLATRLRNAWGKCIADLGDGGNAAASERSAASERDECAALLGQALGADETALCRRFRAYLRAEATAYGGAAYMTVVEEALAVARRLYRATFQLVAADLTTPPTPHTTLAMLVEPGNLRVKLNAAGSFWWPEGSAEPAHQQQLAAGEADRYALVPIQLVDNHQVHDARHWATLFLSRLAAAVARGGAVTAKEVRGSTIVDALTDDFTDLNALFECEDSPLLISCTTGVPITTKRVQDMGSKRPRRFRPFFKLGGIFYSGSTWETREAAACEAGALMVLIHFGHLYNVREPDVASDEVGAGGGGAAAASGGGAATGGGAGGAVDGSDGDAGDEAVDAAAAAGDVIGPFTSDRDACRFYKAWLWRQHERLKAEGGPGLPETVYPPGWQLAAIGPRGVGVITREQQAELTLANVADMLAGLGDGPQTSRANSGFADVMFGSQGYYTDIEIGGVRVIGPAQRFATAREAAVFRAFEFVFARLVVAPVAGTHKQWVGYVKQQFDVFKKNPAKYVLPTVSVANRGIASFVVTRW